MNNLTDNQRQIIQWVQAKCPELMELKKGKTWIQFKSPHVHNFISWGSYDDVLYWHHNKYGVTILDENCGESVELNLKIADFNILGIPPRLANVLKAIGFDKYPIAQSIKELDEWKEKGDPLLIEANVDWIKLLSAWDLNLEDDLLTQLQNSKELEGFLLTFI